MGLHPVSVIIKLNVQISKTKDKDGIFIIDRNGQQAGPFSFDQLVQKGISPETLVWKQGMADWTPAWKVEELRAVLEAIRANQQQAQQQDYQKAQQEAYQQGFQQGAAMNSNSSSSQRRRRAISQ